MTNDIRVVIIDDRSVQACDATCGTDWSSDESLELAREQIRTRFGSDIDLRYVDIAAEKSGDDTGSWKAKIDSDKLNVPLLVLNEQVRISGNFDMRQMMDVIEAESEMGV